LVTIDANCSEWSDRAVEFAGRGRSGEKRREEERRDEEKVMKNVRRRS